VSKKIQRDSDGRFKKGYSANPKGRGTEFGIWLRNNPKSKTVWEKILSAAIDDEDKRQTVAWKLVADRTAPALRASKLEVKDDSAAPVIMIPHMKPEGSPIDPVEDEYDEEIDHIQAEA
jgi:hypothetical protein|tara:strand:- start:4787 stop:5143 length:357 start_codon:yes stop_codon:yes gene_type:complete